MKKFGHFWIDTTFGSFLVWCGVAAALLVVSALELLLPAWLGMALGVALSVLLLAATFGSLIALGVALAQKRWLRALVQVLLGAASIFVFAA